MKSIKSAIAAKQSGSPSVAGRSSRRMLKGTAVSKAINAAKAIGYKNAYLPPAVREQYAQEIEEFEKNLVFEK